MARRIIAALCGDRPRIVVAAELATLTLLAITLYASACLLIVVEARP